MEENNEPIKNAPETDQSQTAPAPPQTVPPERAEGPVGKGRFLKAVLVAFVVIALLGAWWVKHNLYASQFTPTQLSQQEQTQLEAKLARLDGKTSGARPEAYSEAFASREIRITEKELNSLLASNPEMARRVAFDLSRDLVSLKLVVPLDEEIPVLGGKTLRLSIGLVLNYDGDRPVVALKGISLGGVPLPNAWLGGIKHLNLIEEFGESGGFWELFAAGVEDIEVREGHIRIKLKE